MGRKRRPDRPVHDERAIAAIARVDRRTKDLVTRLQPGEVAIIDHEDIDRVSAEQLIQRRALAVVNASRSISGRYPNLGPLLLAAAGIPIIDDAGPAVMRVAEGTTVVIEDGLIKQVNGAGTVDVARGTMLVQSDIEKALDAAKETIAVELERFAENTIGFIRDERDVLLEAARLPEIETDLHGRHVLVVVRGYDYRQDLSALRAYIREVKPILIGVDGGADALIDFGLKPHLIIGDMDSVTSEALLSGAELVVHQYAGGHAPGLERVQALGIECEVFESVGTSEDIAMLLAYERGAELIVAVGTHANLIEFMDKGRKGMASTFLTRLRVGPILVDAKGVSRLYHGRIRRSDLLILILAALVTMAIVIALSEPMRLYMEIVWQRIRDFMFSVRQELFS